MSGYVRPVDAKATKEARKRHQLGVDYLRALFGLIGRPPLNVMVVLMRSQQYGDQTGRGRPVRLRAGCPAVRDVEHARKHERRKRVNAARRRNRR